MRKHYVGKKRNEKELKEKMGESIDSERNK